MADTRNGSEFPEAAPSANDQMTFWSVGLGRFAHIKLSAFVQLVSGTLGSVFVKSEQGKRLMTDAEAEKLSKLEGGAQTWEELGGKPLAFPPIAHTHSYEDLAGKPNIPDAYTDQKATAAAQGILYNALDQLAAGKALDARQGAVLHGYITALQTQTQSLQAQINTMETAEMQAWKLVMLSAV